MKLYLAPLEGITSYIYRKALYQCFDGFDKYFIPFIRAKQNLNFSGREKKDISPENNSGMYAVPQILTRNADDFLRTARVWISGSESESWVSIQNSSDKGLRRRIFGQTGGTGTVSGQDL